MDSSKRRLEIFVKVAEGESIGAAASFFGISQPSVSAHIHGLERQVRVPLFVRESGRRLKLTAAGATVLAYAQKVVALTKELEDGLQEHRSDTQTIRVGAQRLLAARVLPGIVSQFMRRFPAYRLSINSETQEVVYRLLRAGQVDIALIFTDHGGDFESTIVGHQRMVFVAAPTHPLARRSGISLEELQETPFIEGLRESEFVNQLRSILAKSGFIHRKSVLNLQDPQAIKFAVADGLGVSCSFLINVQDEIREGRLKVLDVRCPPITVPVYALRAKGALSTPTRRFLETVERSGAFSETVEAIA